MTGPALIGRTLGGRFRVTGFIGEGAMACVYRGVQEGEPRDVAIKVMHPQLLSDRTFVGRFRREAKAAATIRHPNTVRILDTGVDEKLLYIAMELLAGQDLYEVLTAEGRLAEARAARILVEVCAALEAAHEQGIVHRDLKPENVMLLKGDAGERVKVLDFGIAKILEPEMHDPDGAPLSESSVTALTNVGMVVGTPAYMSPEQCRGETIDARSDVYACGILLYQLVTGVLPFSATTAMDYAVMHVRTTPRSPRELVPGMSPKLEAILLKALGKWPTERQESARTLAEELAAILPELAERPFEEQRLSVDRLTLTDGEPPRRQDTPDPTTMRGRKDTDSELYRTLPSERRMAEAAARASRAETLEILALPAEGAPIEHEPPRDEDPTPSVRALPRSDAPPPSSTFEVFERPPLDDGDEDATRPRRALPSSSEDAPTPLSRPIRAAVETIPRVVYEEPSTPPRAAPRVRAPLRKPASAIVAAPKTDARSEWRAWLLVPVALILGLAIGTVIYGLIGVRQ